jgi:Cft2 family RNA processing exonuclease
MTSVRAISGLGGKGPACFLLETPEARILFDLGEGPQPGLLPDIGSIGKVDALILSHQHADHVGALRFRPEIGNPPVYASAIVGRTLPGDCASKELPLSGTARICDIRVTTGRSGHAPGGIWIHLAIGDNGFIYMGDCCVESPLYAFDPPPPAGVVILDASYGDYEKSIADSYATFDSIVGQGKPVVLPVPAQGRGPEIALHLLRCGVMPCLDEGVRSAILGLCADNKDCVKAETLADLKRLGEIAPEPKSDFRGVTLLSPATCAAPLAKRAIEQLDRDADMHMLFTGYVAPRTPADEVMKSGRGQTMRWNIHPRLSDNAAFVKRMQARTVMPAFGDRKVEAAWEAAFAPSFVIVEGSIEF